MHTIAMAAVALALAACASTSSVQSLDQPVVVTLNYRVGPFAFMAHPQLTAESPDKASGNYALMDQIAALQWCSATSPTSVEIRRR